MAVNKVRRFVNLSKNLDTSGDVGADGIQFEITNADLGLPIITSVHPSDNLSSGDLIFLVGTDFDASANVTLISNTGVRTVAGNVTFNSTSNVTFTWPLEGGSGDLNPYDLRLELTNKGVSTSKFDSANGEVLSFQGTVSGYTSGGLNPYFNTIDKFSLSSDGNATDVGDLNTGVFGGMGSSSTTDGYSSGGASFPGPGTNRIDKFPFASDTNATNVGTQTSLRYYGAGVTSTTHGYAAGGRTPTALNVIDKFPFASDGASSDVGDLLSAKYELAGITSLTHGYVSGGVPSTNVIEKFPVSSDANATDVGDLTVARTGPSGQFSGSHGYTSGGSGSNVIDKFPFASDTNATDVGDLLANKFNSAGHSSTASGYASGGNPNSNVIEKFPFSSDGNSTDVGDLTVARYAASSQQV